MRGCTLTAFVNDAFDTYLDTETIHLDLAEKAKQVAKEESTHPTYYLHKSNPDIKLIGTTRENGETFYLDTEGHKWLMAPDRTLIGIARVRS